MGDDWWYELEEPGSSKKFYVSSSGQASWDAPKSFDVADDLFCWQLKTPKGSEYYYNPASKKTSWVKPGELILSVPPSFNISLPPPPDPKRAPSPSNSLSVTSAQPLTSKSVSSSHIPKTINVSPSQPTAHAPSSFSGVPPPNAINASTRRIHTRSLSTSAAQANPASSSMANTSSSPPTLMKKRERTGEGGIKLLGVVKSDVKFSEKNDEKGKGRDKDKFLPFLFGRGKKGKEKDEFNTSHFSAPFPSGIQAQTSPTRLSLPVDLRAQILEFQAKDFAKKHFTAKRKGFLFKRSIPFQDVIKFSKGPLKGSLIKIHKPHVLKEAENCFKMIQSYMGDRPNKEPLTSIAQSILSKGIALPELRDEIYCQLAKQVTCNPSAESTEKGWELMVLCSLSFPPTKNFEMWLRSFLMSVGDSSPASPLSPSSASLSSSPFTPEQVTKIQTYAKYCLRKMLGQIPTRGKAPEIIEIERGRELPFRQAVFGVSIREVMEAQKDNFEGAPIPVILTLLSETVIKLHGCYTEGIFRVPGDVDVIHFQKCQFDYGVYDTSTMKDPHIPASLMKLWLRELAEPVVPSYLYERCLQSAEDINKLTEIVNTKLPDLNRRILLYVVKFVRLISDPIYQVKTKMTASNLSLVFGPNFLRGSSDNAQTMYENSMSEVKFFLTLVNHYSIDMKDDNELIISTPPPPKGAANGAPKSSAAKNETETEKKDKKEKEEQGQGLDGDNSPNSPVLLTDPNLLSSRPSTPLGFSLFSPSSPNIQAPYDPLSSSPRATLPMTYQRVKPSSPTRVSTFGTLRSSKGGGSGTSRPSLNISIGSVSNPPSPRGSLPLSPSPSQAQSQSQSQSQSTNSSSLPSSSAWPIATPSSPPVHPLSISSPSNEGSPRHTGRHTPKKSKSVKMNSAKLGVVFSEKTEAGSGEWKKESRESRDRVRSSGSDSATELRRVNSVGENKPKVIERVATSSTE